MHDHFQLIVFFGVLTYVLFLAHWIISTDWEAKFNWFSLIIGSTGLLYLHYSNVLLLLQYEPFFVTVWISLLFYHSSIWKSNYDKIRQELSRSTITASLKKYEGSILRFFITIPTVKNAANQWNSPPFRNAIHVLLVLLYSALVILHMLPYLTPLHCVHDISPNCCRYNFVISKFDTQSVNMNYCSGVSYDRNCNKIQDYQTNVLTFISQLCTESQNRLYRVLVYR